MSTKSKRFIFGYLDITVTRSFVSILGHLFEQLKSVNFCD